MNWFTVDAGTGSLILGDHNNTGSILDIVGGTLNGQVLGFTNNSSVTCVVNESTRYRMGGAGSHPFIFGGTGNWIVNNHLRSANSSGIQVDMFGTGTMTWTGTNVGAESVNWFDKLNAVRVGAGGTLIMKSSDLVNADAGSPPIVNNGALWKFDYTPAPGIITTPDTIAGAISGAGPIQVNNGVITFAGASTFSGNINLTGGELIAGSLETVGVSGPLGQNGTISFNGGTLGWNLANAYDYSPRFDTSPGQIYNLDTGGSSPSLLTGLTSSGGTLTKLGGGTLALGGANTYSGLTIVSGGELLFQGTKAGSGNIMVNDSADLGVVENGSPISPLTLTLGSSTGVTLEFNNVTNQNAATLTPVNLVASTPVNILVNSGAFRAIGQIFPLMKWTSGTAPAVTLGFLAGAGGHLVTNVNNVEIDLVIDNPPFIWTAAQDAIWNVASIDWIYSGNATAWTNGNYALLDDSAGNGNVTVFGSIQPTNATINNTALGLTYAITNSVGNNISGPGSLTKSGNGTLTLPGGANSYTGVTTIGGGVLAVNVLAIGGSASDIGAATSANTNIVISGGTLLYTGPGVSVNRLFSVGGSGGTIDSEGAAALAFTNSGLLGMSGNGPRSLTLTGPNAFGDTLACAIANHPAGTTLIKSGAGTWILTGTNTYANGTVLSGGGLQVGTGGLAGTLGGSGVDSVSGTSIDFQRAGTVTVFGAVKGGCSVTSDGPGTVILANNNNYSGGTTINAGTLQVGTGTGAGSLNGVGLINVVNANSILAFNTSGSFAYGSGANGVISGAGNVIVQGGGYIKAIGANTYTGWTLIGANTIFQPYEGQDGGLTSSVVTNNGTLRMVRQDSTVIYGGPIVGTGNVQIGANNVNVGTITLTGTNTYTGGTFIGDNTLILGDGVTVGAGAIPTNSSVVFTNNFTIGQDSTRTLEFNRPAGDDFTFTGTIRTNFTSPQANLGIVQLQGGNTITLTANNSYGSGTIINAGALIIGNGGSTGSVGTGPVTLTSGNPLVINRTGSLAIPGAITGPGGVQLEGVGNATVTLSSAANTYSGATVISNGTLVVTSLGGELEVEGGTVIVHGTTSVSNLTVTGNMNINSGTVVATLDKALSPSNTTYTVSGAINYTGGTLKLLTTGLALTPGDKFNIFSGPVTGGAAMPIVSPGCTVSNGLAVDGSVTVLTAQPLPITASFSVLSGTNFVLSWPAAWTGGVHVQSQTRALTNGLSATAWTTIAGSDAFSSYTNVIGRTAGCVFYRLVIP
jgi:fibronectin-binding autotransporter adhesin